MQENIPQEELQEQTKVQPQFKQNIQEVISIEVMPSIQHSIQKPRMAQNHNLKIFPNIQQLKCTDNNQVLFLCAMKYCNQCAFVCSQKACPCLKKNHKNCKLIRIENFINDIRKKIKGIPEQLNDSLNAIDQIYVRMMDKISQLRQQIKKYKETYGLNHSQISLLESFQIATYLSYTGSDLHIIQQALKKQEIQPKFTVKDVQQHWKTVQPLFSKCCQQLKYFSQMGFPLQSKIVTWKQQQILRKFFSWSIYKFKLLYRASQNNFSIADFHKKCDSQFETVTIIQTDSNYIIGGYNSLTWGPSTNLANSTNLNNSLIWNNSPNGQYKSDNTFSSFIFSLTMKEKFSLIRPLNSVYYRSDFGPTFGAGYDIHIANNAHSNTNSYCDFPHSYNNGNLKNTQQTYKQFCGAQKGCNIRIKQWQVYKIIWQ